MAFTKAAEVANLVKRHVLPGVVISIGQSVGAPGIEVVVRGYSHPEDGMSRVWHIDLLGRSGMMLDLVIRGLRKAGFELSGAAPLMKGRLTQLLNKVELAQMRASERELQRKKEQETLKATLQAETATAARAATAEIDQLKAEIERLKEMLEDMALLPAPRGAQGPQGAPGRDGRDGSATDLAEAALADLGDVSEERPEERMVLTWSGGKWKPLRVPYTSISQIYGGGGGANTAPGEQGPPGKSAYELAVDAGYVGTEEEWLASLQGEAGQTAYELAVEEGFEGTQEEWIESLRGPQGEDGDSTFTCWEQTPEGHLIPTCDPGLQNIGSETNPVGELWATGNTIYLDALPLNIEPTDNNRLYFNGDRLSITDTIIINDLQDVDTDTTAPVVGQILTWDGSNWIPGDAGASDVENLDDLGDVNTSINAPQAGQVLQWNGTSWVPGVYADGNAFPDAPCDGNFYVRHDCHWIELKCALEHLMIGDGGQFSPQGDGGNFTTGYYGSAYEGEYDGGNLIDGSTDAVDNTHLDGQEFFSPYGDGGDFTHDDANGDTSSNIEPDHATDYDGGNFSSGTPSDTCDELDGGDFTT